MDRDFQGECASLVGARTLEVPYLHKEEFQVLHDMTLYKGRRSLTRLPNLVTSWGGRQKWVHSPGQLGQGYHTSVHLRMRFLGVGYALTLLLLPACSTSPSHGSLAPHSCRRAMGEWWLLCMKTYTCLHRWRLSAGTVAERELSVVSHTVMSQAPLPRLFYF